MYFLENLNTASGSQKVVEALALALGDGTNTRETLKTLPVLLKRLKNGNGKGQTLADVISQMQTTLQKADELWRVYKATPMSNPDKAARLIHKPKPLKWLEKVSLRVWKSFSKILTTAMPPANSGKIKSLHKTSKLLYYDIIRKVSSLKHSTSGRLNAG